MRKRTRTCFSCLSFFLYFILFHFSLVDPFFWFWFWILVSGSAPREPFCSSWLLQANTAEVASRTLSLAVSTPGLPCISHQAAAPPHLFPSSSSLSSGLVSCLSASASCSPASLGGCVAVSCRLCVGARRPLFCRLLGVRHRRRRCSSCRCLQI